MTQRQGPQQAPLTRMLRLARRLLTWGLLTAVALALVGVVMLLITGWRALFPDNPSTADRLAMFPVAAAPFDGDVTVYWDEHQIPFIHAESDRDAALALGLVHAHLREGQVAVFKRVSQGRLSEMAGPPTVEIDVAIRTLDLGYAADSIAAILPDQTRQWLDHYLEGFNFYTDRAAATPPEFGLLGLEREPYTLRDMLTISRLAGADVNWFAYFPLLSSRKSSNWPDIWQEAIRLGTNGPASITQPQELKTLEQLVVGSSRSGSNSVVVGAAKSTDGHGMIANDPHLGISIPNFWMLVGIDSPGYHCVGMMIPGLPFFALGRNEHLAWGGTNMRSASSDFYDVSALPPEQFTSRQEKIKVRYWRDREVTIRRTPYGPVMSDASLIPALPGDTLALKWIGHEPTRDLHAFLRANQAGSLSEFVTAFEDYAVSGQNMLAVDNDGNITMTMAVTLPKRPFERPPDLVLEAGNPEHEWQGFLTSTDLPVAVNPSEGFICSANNKPVDHNPPLGYLFSEPERIERLNSLMLSSGTVSVDFLEHLQRDVYSPAAHKLAAQLTAVIDDLHLNEQSPRVTTALRDWDGNYDPSSNGPVAFETLIYHLIQRLIDGRDGQARRFLFRTWNYVSQNLAEDLVNMPPTEASAIMDTALTLAAGDMARFANWGDMHRLRAGYLLSRAPLVGGRFTYDEFPAGGSRETIMKTNHDFTNQRHAATYGSQSRHISLMDDLDHNYFALFGGNDGWLGSENLTDHLALWKSGEYVQVPLRRETAHQRCRYIMTFAPGQPMTLTENE
ncbi:penicillin acylase family protein [candidate division GN15 bacterium]|nr:penicillin acylase family protein [candidate division GN15 bacterium]